MFVLCRTLFFTRSYSSQILFFTDPILHRSYSSQDLIRHTFRTYMSQLLWNMWLKPVFFMYHEITFFTGKNVHDKKICFYNWITFVTDFYCQYCRFILLIYMYAYILVIRNRWSCWCSRIGCCCFYYYYYSAFFLNELYIIKRAQFPQSEPCQAYLFSVNNVPVSFLHFFSELSSRSGSSFKNL